MKKVFYLVSTFIIASCGGGSGNDGSGSSDGFSQDALPPVVSTWLSECIRSSSGSFYLEREYVFYQGEFDRLGHSQKHALSCDLLSRANCAAQFFFE